MYIRILGREGVERGREGWREGRRGRGGGRVREREKKGKHG